MPRFRNYYNKRGNHNRIYSMDELYKMPMGDFIDKEDELDYQDSTIGLPFDEELKSSKNVRFINGFTQDDGNVIPSRWESFAPTTPINPIDGSPSLTGGIIGNTNDKLTQLPSPIKEEPLFKFEKENNFGSIKPYKGDTSSPLWVNGDKLANNLPQQQPQADMTLSDDLLVQNAQNNLPQPQTDIAQIKPLEDNKTQNIQLSGQIQNPVKQVQQPKDAVQPEQPKLSQNLSEYIEELIGDNIDYGFIGDKLPTSNYPNAPIYPENGVIKGGITHTYIPEKDKEILSQSGGYITPTKASRAFDNFDKTNIWLNNKINKNDSDAKQMLEIGIYGIDSYDDNDQFKHIKDGSADLFNEKYKLTGNKTIPSDMKGIEFSEDSDFSKRVSENEDFQQTIKNAIEKNGGKLPEKIELDFSNDSNLNRSIGHGTLLNAHKTDDGYIEGIIFDKYDYEKKEKYKDYKNNPFLNTANNSAEYLHKKNKLEYYYYFVPVRFKY